MMLQAKGVPILNEEPREEPQQPAATAITKPQQPAPTEGAKPRPSAPTTAPKPQPAARHVA